MQRALLPSLFLCLWPCLPAQGSLADLQRQFSEQSRRLGDGTPSREQRDELLAEQTKQLQGFVEKARGDDVWNARLMLADFQLARGDRTAATATLGGIDAAKAPPLLLVTAATMAQHLGLKKERDAWLEGALAKPATLPDQLAMARLLSTVLHEVKSGEALFDKALQAAPDEETQALVRWHRADALRDREDLNENAAFEELEKLANDLPKTYWGGVAKDRLRATRLQVGDPGIVWQATTRGGETISSASLLGKAVVLAFWSAGDMDTPALVSNLRDLQKRFAGSLTIVGVCLDRDEQAIAAAVKELGIDFPVVGEGKGTQTDLALRWFVEGPAVHVLDGRGNVAGLGLHVGTADGRAELEAVVERACKVR